MRLPSVVLLVALAGLLAPAAASALPTDPPVTAVAPATGAALPVNPNGIEVRYTCPPYTVAGESPFTTPGGRKDYGVYFASAPALGTDGRLLRTNLVAIAGPDEVQDNDLPDGTCRGFMADPGNRPETKPGTYYWQVYRLCLDCPGSYEVTEVRSFRLTAAGSGVQLAFTPPKRVYRGFPFAATATTTGLTSGTAVALQVKRGSTWSTFATLRAGSQRAEGPAQLPKALKPATYQVRAQAKVGTETITSTARSLKLRKADKRSTSKRQDGSWKGKAGSLPVSFKVSGKGRTISAGRFQLALLCPTPGMVSQFTTQIADAPLTKAKIAPDGSFAWAGTVKGHAAYVDGKLTGRSAVGTVRLTLGTCTGRSTFKASKG